MFYLKRIVRLCLNRLGLNIKISKTQPYFYVYQKPRFTEYNVNLLGHTFRIIDSRSFYFGYDEIFMREIYKFRCSTDDPIILDCGANVGLSVVYFKSIFPTSKITAIEADPKIFDVLSKNCEHLDIKLLQRAISHNNEPIRFYCEGTDGGRAEVAFGDNREPVIVDSITLDDLITRPVDFLKIDIKGAETAALIACTKLNIVNQMFIEYHSFVDREQSLSDILDKLRKDGFRYYIHQQFCSKKPFFETEIHMGMDLQLNIFCMRNSPVLEHGHVGSTG